MVIVGDCFVSFIDIFSRAVVLLVFLGGVLFFVEFRR